jgi:hypothetical protein
MARDSVPLLFQLVKRRNTRREHMFSAVTPATDIAQHGQHVRSVP